MRQFSFHASVHVWQGMGVHAAKGCMQMASPQLAKPATTSADAVPWLQAPSLYVANKAEWVPALLSVPEQAAVHAIRTASGDQVALVAERPDVHSERWQLCLNHSTSKKDDGFVADIYDSESSAPVARITRPPFNTVSNTTVTTPDGMIIGHILHIERGMSRYNKKFLYQLHSGDKLLASLETDGSWYNTGEWRMCDSHGAILSLVDRGKSNKDARHAVHFGVPVPGYVNSGTVMDVPLQEAVHAGANNNQDVPGALSPAERLLALACVVCMDWDKEPWGLRKVEEVTLPKDQKALLRPRTARKALAKAEAIVGSGDSSAAQQADYWLWVHKAEGRDDLVLRTVRDIQASAARPVRSRPGQPGQGAQQHCAFTEAQA